MIAYRFGREDLLHTRFAISPLFELQASVSAVRDPGAHSVHLPWVRAARQRLAGFDYTMFDALLPERGYAPDFIAPPPRTPLPDVAAEFERVRSTEPAQVRRELGWRFEVTSRTSWRRCSTTRPVASRCWSTRWPATGSERWRHGGTSCWGCSRPTSATAPRAWPRWGAEPFAGLHAGVRWHRGTLEVEAAVDAEVDLAGRGVQLVPSAFVWPRTGAMFDPPWQPA